MGQKESSPFTEAELQDYQDLTYFTKKEILYAFRKFKSISPEIIEQDRHARLPMEVVMKIPELHVNPYKDRICKVFSSADDGTISFEDFLDMMSVLSRWAPRSVKTEYAFRIFDFDEDDMISERDLRESIKRLISGGNYELPEHEIKEIIANIMAESDMDEDNALSYSEFEHIISKSADFMTSFRIRL